MADTIRGLNIYADFEYDFKLTRKNATTRAVEPATGLSGVTGRFALTRTGTALSGTSTALTEAGTTGRYVGVLDAAALAAALAAELGKVVYAICSKSGDIDNEVQAYRVLDHHEMGR